MTILTERERIRARELLASGRSYLEITSQLLALRRARVEMDMFFEVEIVCDPCRDVK